MENKEFSKIIKGQLTSCQTVLVSKGEEYATQDMLHNFRVAANMMGCSMSEALAGMMAKHTVSIYDMIKSEEDFDMEKWDEKITDHLNYLLLLKAILVEEKKTTQE